MIQRTHPTNPPHSLSESPTALGSPHAPAQAKRHRIIEITLRRVYHAAAGKLLKDFGKAKVTAFY
ncbi:hypothetical protein [Neorhodopirellula pilleata]|uniref:Uncharacterized protein n=1 Tax=Neorhodopirellula pilleata TaxID=2714738 RepID=A0A5C6AWC7_9BACT|nr:hypothetical protein [Neorhodopirellula pilleata]TWU03449.1 hypothetical protein Pla100_03760 [Neorhodopirellula pilleata]